MAFRARQPVTGSTDIIAMTWLDEDFNPLGPPIDLEVPIYNTGIPSKKQDPRLIVIAESLYMVYSNVIRGLISPEVRRMFVTKVYFDGIRFYTDDQEGIFNFDDVQEQRWQKNWVPFEYEGNLLLGYSLTPHRIEKPFLGQDTSIKIAESNGNIIWKWGTLRGGTQAYLDGEEYLSFFHSSCNMQTIHSQGKNMPHYVMGAYTFSAQPPFEITRISPEPIVGKGFYTGPAYKTWKPLRVVFPGGYIFDDKYIWIVYGKQDHEIWVAKLDKKKLYKSLVPVITKE